MVKKLLFLVFLIPLITVIFAKDGVPSEKSRFWDFQSIDTMKYSRDIAREKINDNFFDNVIKTQAENIAKIGATHIAIATPYDDEFIPFLKRWVKAARANGLKVWFRGNFSGWEKWFSYQSISREEHIKKTQFFILDNKDLFADGDIFSGCPECENGGPGDPRLTRDIEGHRLFLIAEYQIAEKAFKAIGKNVRSNFNSMNYDVAYAVMDKRTTESLGGVIAIDHYTKTPEKLISDIKKLADKSQGKIFLGEFGVPIPDINGMMTENQQADWINEALIKLAYEPKVIGFNYWVNLGGSTSIWNDNGTEKKAVNVLRSFFRPKIIKGTVKKYNGRPIRDAKVIFNNQSVLTSDSGSFQVIYNTEKIDLKIIKEDYLDKELTINKNKQNINIIMESINKGFLEYVIDLIRSIKVK